MPFTLSVQDSGPIKIQAIKAIREATGCNLKDAKDVVESNLTLIVRDEEAGPLGRTLTEMQVRFTLSGTTGELTPSQAMQLFQAARAWKNQGSRSRLSTGPSLVLWDLVDEFERTVKPKELRAEAPTVYDRILEEDDFDAS